MTKEYNLGRYCFKVILPLFPFFQLWLPGHPEVQSRPRRPYWRHAGDSRVRFHRASGNLLKFADVRSVQLKPFSWPFFAGSTKRSTSLGPPCWSRTPPKSASSPCSWSSFSPVRYWKMPKSKLATTFSSFFFVQSSLHHLRGRIDRFDGRFLVPRRTGRAISKEEYNNAGGG